MDATTIRTLLAGLGVGVAAGAHTATWGMYKDAPHEGFTWRKYGRSIALSAALGPAAATAAGLDASGAAGAVVLFGLVYALERALVEFYKTFIREEDQSKYSIPMQFAVLGKVVEERAPRWAAAAAVVAVAALLAVWAASMGDATSLPLAGVVAIGSAAGWVSAIGGAWKDAPVEGFHLLKFFRSPAIAGALALIVSRLEARMVVVALCALGYTVAITETYKTFFFPRKPRGKFAGKPIAYPDWLRLRRRFVPLYVGIWVLIFAAVSHALSSGAPREEKDVGIGRRRAAGGVVRVGHEIDAQHTARPSPREDALEVGTDVPQLADPLAEVLIARLGHDPVAAYLPQQGHDRGLLIKHGPRRQGAGPDVGDLVNGPAVVLGDQHAELRCEIVALAQNPPAAPDGGGVVDEAIDLPAPREEGMVRQRDEATLIGALEDAADEGCGRPVAVADPPKGGVDLGWAGEGRHLPDQGRRSPAVKGDDTVREGDLRWILAFLPVAAVPALDHVELDGSRSRRLSGRCRNERRGQEQDQRGCRTESHGSRASSARTAPDRPAPEAGWSRRANGWGAA